jgi:uptake hydrogenase large subunit
MSAGAGCLVLRARLREGVVEKVEIVSPRVDPSPVFIGLKPEEAAVLAGRLFSLCPVSQSLAARAAGEAALGAGIDGATQRRRGLGLLCERLGEMLRASLLDWPGATPAPAEILRLREALKALRALPQSGAAVLPDLRAAMDGLGLGDANENSFFARQIVEARADEGHWDMLPLAADFLCAGDDAAIFAAMIRDRGFSRAPNLPGRRPETGASARRGGCGNLVERLEARRDDMAAAVDTIENLLRGGDPPQDALIATGGNGRGFAAVDSARGRLYHSLHLDGAGRIADYRIVAPTEWNFHPEGPYAKTLRGARIGGGAEAKRRIERLAFVFDPCIRAMAEISDANHA